MSYAAKGTTSHSPTPAACRTERETTVNYLEGYRTNPQIRRIHNLKAVQSRKGWTQAEALKALSDANSGLAYEFCDTCRRWTPLDCRGVHPSKR